MSQISRKNSFGKVVFPFLVGNFMSRDGNCFFGHHFVIVYPIFDIFCCIWFFWITLSVARISPPNSFGKELFWVRVHRDPPWPLTGVHYTLTILSVTLNPLKLIKSHQRWWVIRGFEPRSPRPRCARYFFLHPLSFSFGREVFFFFFFFFHTFPTTARLGLGLIHNHV